MAYSLFCSSGFVGYDDGGYFEGLVGQLDG